MAKGITAGFSKGYLVVRIQSRCEISINLNNGRIQNVSTSREKGIGVQAFTERGACGFASADNLDRTAADHLATRAYELALKSEKIGCELNSAILSAPKINDDIPSAAALGFDEITPERLQKMIGMIHQRLLDIKAEEGTAAWQTSYRQIEDYWCISRTDGSIVSFVIPRSVIVHQGTVKHGDASQSFSINRSDVDAGILLKEEEDRLLHNKALDKMSFISKVCIAPQIQAGSYPIVIDYALAKGLAHEAFGHAVESDLSEESILSAAGKLKKGLVISDNDINIIDESIKGDWAYQPYSANGIIRKPVEIVKNGVLQNGLGDIYSSAKAGIDITGAGRTEYYGSVPLPRMSNIRLETAENLSLPDPNNMQDEIKNLRKVLEQRNLLEKDHHFLLLGYRGGQVNPRTGDFVFQCDGAVNLADPCLPVYEPGIFSGKILSVLESVKLSIGKKKVDAIGTCGKAGQLVPSSGGASGYISISRNQNIRLGGNANE